MCAGSPPERGAPLVVTHSDHVKKKMIFFFFFCRDALGTLKNIIISRRTRTTTPLLIVTCGLFNTIYNVEIQNQLLMTNKKKKNYIFTIPGGIFRISRRRIYSAHLLIVDELHRWPKIRYRSEGFRERKPKPAITRRLADGKPSRVPAKRKGKWKNKKKKRST